MHTDWTLIRSLGANFPPQGTFKCLIEINVVSHQIMLLKIIPPGYHYYVYWSISMHFIHTNLNANKQEMQKNNNENWTSVSTRRRMIGSSANAFPNCRREFVTATCYRRRRRRRGSRRRRRKRRQTHTGAQISTHFNVQKISAMARKKFQNCERPFTTQNPVCSKKIETRQKLKKRKLWKIHNEISTPTLSVTRESERYPFPVLTLSGPQPDFSGYANHHYKTSTGIL